MSNSNLLPERKNNIIYLCDHSNGILKSYSQNNGYFAFRNLGGCFYMKVMAGSIQLGTCGELVTSQRIYHKLAIQSFHLRYILFVYCLYCTSDYINTVINNFLLLTLQKLDI